MTTIVSLRDSMKFEKDHPGLFDVSLAGMLVVFDKRYYIVFIPKYSTTEFCQGKTMRWGIAWTFDKTVNFPKSLFQQSKKEKPPLIYPIPEDITDVKYDLVCIFQSLKELLKELKINFKELVNTETLKTLDISAKENTWSHQRRKRRGQLRQTDSKPTEKKVARETTSTKDTEQMTSAVVKGELTSTVVTGPRQSTSTIKTENVTSTALKGEITSTKVAGKKDFSKSTVQTKSLVTGEVTSDIPTCTSNSSSLQQANSTPCENCNEESVKNSESTCTCDSSKKEEHVNECTSKIDSECNDTTFSKMCTEDDENDVLNKKVLGTTSKKRKRSINDKTGIDEDQHNKHAKLDPLDQKQKDHSVSEKVSESCNSENLVLPVKSCDSEESSLNTVYEDTCKDELFLLHCFLRVKVVSGKINLEMEWIDGEQKDSMQQVMQFFKNKFSTSYIQHEYLREICWIHDKNMTRKKRNNRTTITTMFNVSKNDSDPPIKSVGPLYCVSNSGNLQRDLPSLQCKRKQTLQLENVIWYERINISEDILILPNVYEKRLMHIDLRLSNGGLKP
ncbi:hypothetical protein KUTeg_010460 [Tegillarca granosa]|uniref:Uncharacterized protein n=1 Tax=Tegillarca granosa TaxID=220873 RepID=A0ABQ9F6V2_TEGGR|nr:hypothetical protein KUTeg_010460 [Tegillarca granosa]